VAAQPTNQGRTIAALTMRMGFSSEAMTDGF
jgi:hypothetical protein